MRIKILNIEQALSEKLKKVQKELHAPELLERVGRQAVRDIQKRTRQGLDHEGKLFKPLKNSTIDKRKKLSKVNKVSAYYNHAISNIHFTGQLLRALTYRVTQTSQGFFSFSKKSQVFLEVGGKRKPYVTAVDYKENKAGTKAKAVKKRSSSAPNNSELTKFLKDQGREFLGVDEPMKQRIRETVARHVKKFLRSMRRT